MRAVGVLIGVLLVGMSCGSEGSLVIDGSAGEPGPAVLAEGDASSGASGEVPDQDSGDVPVGEMVATGAAGVLEGVVTLASAATDALTVRWDASFAPDAAGFLLRWRLRPVPEDEELSWLGEVKLDGTVREHKITALTAGTPYRLRLIALDAVGNNTGKAAVADFETLAPPVRNFTGSAAAHDAVSLSWDAPAGWSPVGYVVQWRLRGPDNPFLGRLELPAGRRSQLVTGLSGGVEHVFRLTARTATGWQSRPAVIGVFTPAAPANNLTLEISAPHHCIASEGRSAGYGWGGPEEDRYWVREGVASVAVQWRISGGTAPYVVRVAGSEARGISGTTDVTCALAGIDLNNLKDPDLNVVESGPKTITIEATDAAGATTTRTHTVEIIETVGSAGGFYDGVTLTPGRTYYDWGRYFETPEGHTIAAGGLILAETSRGPEQYVVFRHVVEGSRHTEAAIDLHTGERIGTWVTNKQAPLSWRNDYGATLTPQDLAVWDTFFAGVRNTPFPPGDPRNEPPAPLAPEVPGAASARQRATAGICLDPNDNVVDRKAAHLWRPYGQLPNGHQGLRCSEIVTVHPRMLGGEPITVCVEGTIHDALFNLPAGLFGESLAAAIADWNGKLAGLGYSPLKRDATSPACPTGLTDSDVAYVRVFDGRNCQVMRTCPHDVAGWRLIRDISEELPRAYGNNLEVFRSAGADADAKRDALKRVFRHELGHFLGLADYGRGCWRLLDAAGVVQPSLMSYGQLTDEQGNPVNQPDGPADPTALDPPGCLSTTITSRDLDDSHAIYHPLAVTGLTLRRAGGRSVLSWAAPAGTPSDYNTTSLGIFQRALWTRDGATGTPAGRGPWGLVARSVAGEDVRQYTFSGDVAGWEYAVAGLTAGDHRRGSDPDVLGLRHKTVTLPVPTPLGGSRTLTIGEPSNVVSAPPPIGMNTLGFDGFGEVHFGETGAGKWRFSIYGSARTVSGISVGAGDILIATSPARRRSRIRSTPPRSRARRSTSATSRSPYFNAPPAAPEMADTCATSRWVRRSRLPTCPCAWSSQPHRARAARRRWRAPTPWTATSSDSSTTARAAPATGASRSGGRRS